MQFIDPMCSINLKIPVACSNEYPTSLDSEGETQLNLGLTLMVFDADRVRARKLRYTRLRVMVAYY